MVSNFRDRAANPFVSRAERALELTRSGGRIKIHNASRLSARADLSIKLWAAECGTRSLRTRAARAGMGGVRSLIEEQKQERGQHLCDIAVLLECTRSGRGQSVLGGYVKIVSDGMKDRHHVRAARRRHRTQVKTRIRRSIRSLFWYSEASRSAGSCFAIGTTSRGGACSVRRWYWTRGTTMKERHLWTSPNARNLVVSEPGWCRGDCEADAMGRLKRSRLYSGANDVQHKSFYWLASGATFFAYAMCLYAFLHVTGFAEPSSKQLAAQSVTHEPLARDPSPQPRLDPTHGSVGDRQKHWKFPFSGICLPSFVTLVISVLFSLCRVARCWRWLGEWRKRRKRGRQGE